MVYHNSWLDYIGFRTKLSSLLLVDIYLFSGFGKRCAGRNNIGSAISSHYKDAQLDVNVNDADNSQMNALSSSVKNFAEARSAGMIDAAMRAIRTVAIPSRMKIHFQPASPAIPSIFRMAEARRPASEINTGQGIRLSMHTSKCARQGC